MTHSWTPLTDLPPNWQALASSELAALALVGFQDRTEEGVAMLEGPYPLGESVFQFSYKDDTLAAVERFEQWIEAVLILGLDQWRRQL